jgi:hypothetical protein
MSDTIVVKDPLNPRERAAYDLYIQKGMPDISPVTQAQFLSLFLRGKTCEEIHQINSSFPLGAIVKCRVDGDWDKRLEDYRNMLFDTVRDRVIQIEMESTVFLTDLLAAAHKQHGDKVKKYLQTGDKSELGELQITSIKNYKETLELLLKSTGQDSEKTVRHKIETSGPATVNINNLHASSSSDAAELMKILTAKKDE